MWPLSAYALLCLSMVQVLILGYTGRAISQLLELTMRKKAPQPDIRRHTHEAPDNLDGSNSGGASDTSDDFNPDDSDDSSSDEEQSSTTSTPATSTCKRRGTFKRTHDNREVLKQSQKKARSQGNTKSCNKTWVARGVDTEVVFASTALIPWTRLWKRAGRHCGLAQNSGSTPARKLLQHTISLG